MRGGLLFGGEKRYGGAVMAGMAKDVAIGARVVELWW